MLSNQSCPSWDGGQILSLWFIISRSVGQSVSMSACPSACLPVSPLLSTHHSVIYSFIPNQFLARQLVDYPHGNGLEVMFGGGREKFMSKNDTDPEYPNETGERLDGRNLIKEWIEKYPNSQYVWNKTGFDQIVPEKVDHVMG